MKMSALLFNYLIISKIPNLESSTHAVVANTEALWFSPLCAGFVLFLISLLRECVSLLGEGSVFQSHAFFLFIFFSQPQEFGWLEQSVKTPGRTPLVMGAPPRPHSCLVWVASNQGDAQWRSRLEMVMFVVHPPRMEPYSQGHAFQQSL